MCANWEGNYVLQCRQVPIIISKSFSLAFSRCWIFDKAREWQERLVNVGKMKRTKNESVICRSLNQFAFICVLLFLCLVLPKIALYRNNIILCYSAKSVNGKKVNVCICFHKYLRIVYSCLYCYFPVTDFIFSTFLFYFPLTFFTLCKCFFPSSYFCGSGNGTNLSKSWKWNSKKTQHVSYQSKKLNYCIRFVLSIRNSLFFMDSHRTRSKSTRNRKWKHDRIQNSCLLSAAFLFTFRNRRNVCLKTQTPAISYPNVINYQFILRTHVAAPAHVSVRVHVYGALYLMWFRKAATETTMTTYFGNVINVGMVCAV